MGMSGIQATDATARAEARLVFGTFHLMAGLFFAWARLSGALPTRTTLSLVALLLGAMGATRLAVMAIEGAWSSFHYLGLAIDFGVSGLALWARAGVSAALSQTEPTPVA